VSVATLLSRATIPIIDLSHMGECPTIQLSRVLPKKLNVEDDFDGERFFCAGKSIRVKSAYIWGPIADVPTSKYIMVRKLSLVSQAVCK
jgi:hypothetical protein